MNQNTIFIPNHFQVDIFDFIADERKGNLIVEALAGTGKTVTIVESLNKIPRNKKVLFLAYNRHIKDDLQKKSPRWVDVRTTHSVGLETIKNFNAEQETNHTKDVNYKIHNILRKVISDRNIKYEAENNASEIIDKYLVKRLQSRLVGIINHFRNSLLLVNEDELDHVIGKYELFLPCIPHKTLLEIIAETLKRDREDTLNVDFTDMLYLPTALMMDFNKYDYILIDESQDLNESQLRMLLMLRSPEGRIIAIGDRKQALYSFRGADNDALDKIALATKAEKLPLNICYRCPKTHIKMANEYVPEMEPAPGAIDGEIYKISGERLDEFIKPGDIALCRNNAPLIRPALSLLKQGIKINIRGQNLKKSLIELIKKTKTNNVEEMHRMLIDYRDTEVEKLKEKNKNPLPLIDKVDVILEFSREANDVQEIIEYIDILLNDKDAQITFSTVHSAKGTEADNIFFINSFLIPSPYAKQDWERQGEKNIMYVALTRAKKKLYFVDIHRWEPSELVKEHIENRDIKIRNALRSVKTEKENIEIMDIKHSNEVEYSDKPQFNPDNVCKDMSTPGGTSTFVVPEIVLPVFKPKAEPKTNLEPTEVPVQIVFDEEYAKTLMKK